MTIPNYVKRFYVPGYNEYYKKDEQDNKSVFFFLYSNSVYSEPSNIDSIFMHFIYSLSRDELGDVLGILEKDTKDIVSGKSLKPITIYGEDMDPCMDYIDALFKIKKLILISDYENNKNTDTLISFKTFVTKNNIALDPYEYDPELYALLETTKVTKFGRRRSYKPKAHRRSRKAHRRNRRSKQKTCLRLF
jgi:hypothetical protein